MPSGDKKGARGLGPGACEPQTPPRTPPRADCPTKPLIHLHRRLPGRPPGRDERLHEIWVHPRRHLPSLCDSGLSYRMEMAGGLQLRHLPGPSPSPAHNPQAPPLGVASPHIRPRPPVSCSTPGHSPAHTDPASPRTQPPAWAADTAPPPRLRPHPRNGPAHQPPAPPPGATRRRRSKVNPTITYLALFSRPLALACRPTGPAVGPCSSTRMETKCPNTVPEITSSCTR